MPLTQTILRTLIKFVLLLCKTTYFVAKVYPLCFATSLSYLKNSINTCCHY